MKVSNKWRSFILMLLLIFGISTSTVAQQEQYVLYWDVSSSMQDRNIPTEMKFLQEYLASSTKITLYVRPFSNTLQSTQSFEILSGNVDMLKGYLEGLYYDGASNADLVDLNTPNTTFFVSTDGNFVNDIKKEGNSKLVVINSTPDVNIDGITKLTTAPGDQFITLGASIETYKPLERPKVNTDVDATMELNEVKISRNQKSSLETTATAYGKQNKDAIGYDVKSITNEQITPVNTDVSTAVQGQFAGVQLNRNADISRIKIRTTQTITGNQYALIVIDGIPMPQADSASDTGNESRSATDRIFSFVDPEQIEKITVLKSHASTNKYGSLGVNGVIEILTNRNSGNQSENREKAIGTTATYSGSSEAIKALPHLPYIEQFKSAKTLEAAYETYQNLKSTYGNSPEYYINAADYFIGWENPNISLRILSNVQELFYDDSTALRSLAYGYEKIGEQKSAIAIYKMLYDNWPNEVRNYRDLALAYSNAGDIENAFAIYEQVFELPFTKPLGAFKDTFMKEYKTFVNKNTLNINLNKVSPRYKQNAPKLFRRFVIEWDDPTAQFDINIINPQKRFFTWEHTKQGAAQRLISEQKIGFGSEEFFLTSQDKGEWNFNVIYRGVLGGDIQKTHYLKFTMYEHYGTPKQTEQVKILRLDELDKELTGFTVKI